jgi:hypothetical protein
MDYKWEEIENSIPDEQYNLIIFENFILARIERTFDGNIFELYCNSLEHAEEMLMAETWEEAKAESIELLLEKLENEIDYLKDVMSRLK